MDTKRIKVENKLYKLVKLRMSLHAGRSPTKFWWEIGQTHPNVNGIWWGRVRIWQLATLIFWNPSPPTNLLLHVTKDGVLDYTPLVTNICKLKSGLVGA